MGIATPSDRVRPPEEQWRKLLWQMRMLPLRFRLTHIPVIGKYLSRRTFVGDPTARNWVIPVAEPISADMANVHLPLDLLKPLIEKAAYRAIAHKCICRSAFECKNYPHDVACLALGSGLASAGDQLEAVSTEEAIAHVEKAINLGLVPTIVWDQDSEFGGAPRNKGIVICVCCDCCCDIRLGLRMGTNEFRKKVFRPEGVSVVVSEDCNLCGICVGKDVCSPRAIALGPMKAQIDLSLCVGCGRCVQVCPTKAISFEIDPEVDIVGSLISQVESYTDLT